MLLLLMLGLYLGLFICTLLYLKKTSYIKLKTQIRAKQRNTAKRYGNDNVKRRTK